MIFYVLEIVLYFKAIYWQKWKLISSIFAVSDCLLSDWSRFYNILYKEKLWNFDQFHSNAIFETNSQNHS